MQKELPVRKYIRLKNYDYSQYGPYFVTFCVEDKCQILGDIVVGSGFHARPQVELTDIGRETQKTIEYITSNDQRIEISQYIIMPNHVHMIVILNDIGIGDDVVGIGNNAVGVSDNAVGHGSPTLQSVVGRIKSYTAKQFSEICGTKYQTIWQRSYHEHIIRNEVEYEKISKYIDENPTNWETDRYF